MSQLKVARRIVLVDLGYFFRTKWLILTLVSLNLSDMLVAGLVYTNIMSINYFLFFAPGVVVAGMYTAALDVGRRVHLGLTEGVTQYYLSLPVSLDMLAVSHLVSAGLGGLLYSLLILAFGSLVVPGLVSVETLAIIPFMFFVSMGLGGIAAIINLLSGGGERYWPFAEGIQSLLLGLSTVFYPISIVDSFFPKPITYIVLANPITQITEALRQSQKFLISPESFSLLVLSSAVLMIIGFLCYRHVFSKLRELGKI